MRAQKRATAATKAAALASSRPGSFDSDLELLGSSGAARKAAAGPIITVRAAGAERAAPEPRGASAGGRRGYPPGDRRAFRDRRAGS